MAGQASAKYVAAILAIAILPALPGMRARAAQAHTVQLTLIGGKTQAAGGYNFNGYADGQLVVTVPLGWTVTVQFENAASPPHSVAVLPYSDPQPAEGTRPAFPGATTPNLQGGIPRGARATFSFVASRPGTYEFACGVAGHAIAGMWATLIVSPTATAATTQIRPPRSPAPPPSVASGTTAVAGPDLPGNVLIADAGNNRRIEVTPDKRIVWEFPRPGDLGPGQTFVDPDDAFYTPGGRTIITNEEDNHTIALIDYATHKIVWEYGHPGQPGSGPGYLDTPDDAYQLPDGRIVVAD
ncbi:MAG TPA: sulfocyanin-like copper-binding protein, partial [bacterium]|nr:sulfocyanin-like copper-binding protein [bacterium]